MNPKAADAATTRSGSMGTNSKGKIAAQENVESMAGHAVCENGAPSATDKATAPAKNRYACADAATPALKIKLFCSASKTRNPREGAAPGSQPRFHSVKSAAENENATSIAAASAAAVSGPWKHIKTCGAAKKNSLDAG